MRMRQKCEGQVCEGQECECDFSAIGQNSEVIQIERSRSFCLQDGVFFLSFSLSLSLSLSGYTLGIMKGGTQGFPRHEVSDKQEAVDELKMP